MSTPPPIRFAAIGLNHAHIYGQVNLLRAGPELGAVFTPEPELVTAFARAHPQAHRAASLCG